MLQSSDLEELARARRLLSKPGLAAKITHAIGVPLDRGIALLPAEVKSAIDASANKAIASAAAAAFATMDTGALGAVASNRLHKFMAAGVGALGGLFGLPALVIELPLTTSIILRSIADIARSEHANLHDPQTRVECLSVFALGGPGSEDDAAESGYYAVRIALANSVSEVAQFIAARSGAEAGAPAVTNLVAKVSARFGPQVTQKIAAQAAPILGAAGGAFVNRLFISHYQDTARGHFIVKRLEATYGQEAVQHAYALLERPLTEVCALEHFADAPSPAPAMVGPSDNTERPVDL
jgi:hypothetical protein